MKIRCAWYVCMLTALSAHSAAAASKTYAVVIGNNAPPHGSALAVLQYADDDGARYFDFFKRVADDTYLLTVPDRRTQERYKGIASVARLPNMETFDRVIGRLRAKIQRDRAEGNESMVFFAFSGHGDHSADGTPYLSLLDGRITQQKLHDSLKALNADFIHVFIDACYAESVVGFRGMFDNERDARHVTVTAAQSAEEFEGNRDLYFDLPGLGVVTAASVHQRTHEWSEIESGVFTYEVLSGLAGPADINMDGNIEYSELSAFVSVANADVKDERGRIKLIAKPPSRNQNVALVDLRRLNDVSFLVGNPSHLGHFYIELGNGQRYLDANLGNMKSMHIALPTEQLVFLFAGGKEASIPVDSLRVVDANRLKFKEHRYSSRGSIESALEKGLFRVEYGISYYLGYIGSWGFLSVPMDVAAWTPVDSGPGRDNRRLRRKLAVAGFSLSGAAAVAAGALGVLALGAKHDVDTTELQRQSAEAGERYTALSTAFWITLAVVPAALILGIVAMPKKGHAARTGTQGRLSISFAWNRERVGSLIVEF